MAIKFLSGQTVDGTLTVSGNVQGATFNGLAINTTGLNNVANQIVRTDSYGYANFGWIQSTSGNHTGSITRITASNDQYLRYVTPAQFRTGVTDGYYAPVSTVTGVTSVATGNGLTGGTIISTGTLTMSGSYTGAFSVTGFTTSTTGFGINYVPGATVPMVILANATTYGIFYRESSPDHIEFKHGGTVRQSFDGSGNISMTGDLTVSGGDITLGGTGRIQGVDTVTATTDAANKAYVDAHPGSGGTVTGTGTNDYIPRWNAAGTGIENSLLIDTGALSYTTSQSVILNLKGTSAPGYAEINIKNDVNNFINIGSIGSTYSQVDWTNSAYVYNTGTGRNLWLKSQNDLGLFAGGTSIANNLKVIIKPTGNVGIGTTSPTTKLDVNGGITSTGVNFLNQSNLYNNSVPGISSFGDITMDSTVSFFSTGKYVAVSTRGMVWTGKYYIVTNYTPPFARFYTNNFDLVPGPEGNTITLPLPATGGQNYPHGGAWDGRYLYCVVYGGTGAKIVGYDLDNGTTTATLVIESFMNNAGATYDIEYAEGHLYTVTDGAVSRYKLEGKTITHVFTSGNILGSIEAQAITYDGSYLWITQNAQSVYKVNLDCTLAATITTGVPPNNVAWAWNGENINAVNYQTGEIYIVRTAAKRFDTEEFLVMGGNVGIGTTSPFANATTNTGLNVDTGGHSSLLIGDGINDGGMIQSSDNSQRIIIGANVYDSPTGSWSRWNATGAALIDVYGEANSAFISLNVDDGTSGFPPARLFIDGNGKVGIGTTSPDYKFEVQGVISSADAGLQKATFANVGTDLVLTANADATNVTAKMLFKSSGSGGGAVSEKMSIQGDGNVVIGGYLTPASSGVTYTSLLQLQKGFNTSNEPDVVLKINNLSSATTAGTGGSRIVFEADETGNGNGDGAKRHSIESMYFGGVANWKIRSGNDFDQLCFDTGGSERMRITETGAIQTPANPAFRARTKYAQTYAAGWQHVIYDESVTSRGTGYASSRFTAPVDGWYQFNAQWTASNNADVDGTLSIWINGSSSNLAASVSMPNTGGSYDGHTISGCCYLAATHYVQVHRYSSVSNTTRTSAPYGGWFSGFLIG